MEQPRASHSPVAGAPRLRIGVSACLLGRPVRYDGGHKREPCIADGLDGLAAVVELVEVCPEAELGMGVPRETVRLVRLGSRTRMVGTASARDHTAAMERFAEERADELARRGIAGFVLKSDSPSCGVRGVRLLGEDGVETREGVGLFAAALLRRMPGLPVEEEARLREPAGRERFLERARAYRDARVGSGARR